MGIIINRAQLENGVQLSCVTKDNALIPNEVKKALEESSQYKTYGHVLIVQANKKDGLGVKLFDGLCDHNKIMHQHLLLGQKETSAFKYAYFAISEQVFMALGEMGLYNEHKEIVTEPIIMGTRFNVGNLRKIAADAEINYQLSLLNPPIPPRS